MANNLQPIIKVVTSYFQVKKLIYLYYIWSVDDYWLQFKYFKNMVRKTTTL
jgi:hypothetical protein